MGRRSRKPEARRTSLAETVAARPLRAVLLVIAVVLAGTVDERLFGVISDEQQMHGTAVAMAELGEIGIARGQVFMVHRPAGDAVSPYGMGTSLLLAVPALVAEPWERSFGGGSSQTLFVLVPLGLVLAGAWLAGLLARDLGGGEAGAVVAALAASVASPLWGYTGTAYSEPLQAVAFAGAVLLALRAGRALGQGTAGPGVDAPALGAGFLAGCAVLAKSVNLVVVPFLVAPLLIALLRSGSTRARVRAFGLAAGGAAVPAGLWLAFEIVRFGRPFTSYGGNGFTHPFLDGLWRLLVGPNEGLLLYFPPLLAAGAGLWLLARDPERRPAALALGGPFLVLLAVSSAWWSWDGVGGWGPRFLVPALPLLAAAAGVATSTFPRGRAAAKVLLGLGVVVNLLGVFVSDTAVTAWIAALPGTELSKEEAAKFPSFFLERTKAGRLVLPRVFSTGSDASFSRLRLHLAVLRLQLLSDDPRSVEAGLARPPWLDRHPEAVPDFAASRSADNAGFQVLSSPFSWPRLGRALAGRRGVDDSFNRAWGSAIADQVLRNLDIGRPDRALRLAERLFEISPSGYSAALLAESQRASGRLETARAFLASLPPPFRASPSLGVVGALIARDAGDEASARSLLEQVSKVFPRPGLVAALGRPIAEWPRGLHQMTGENLEARELGLPKVGGGAAGPR